MAQTISHEAAPQVKREQKAKDYAEGHSRLQKMVSAFCALSELVDDGTCLKGIKLSEDGQAGLAALFGILYREGWDALEAMPFPQEMRAFLGLEPGKEEVAHV